MDTLFFPGMFDNFASTPPLSAATWLDCVTQIFTHHFALGFSTLLTLLALKRRSLTHAGCAVAFVTGQIAAASGAPLTFHNGLCMSLPCASLAFFFLSSTLITKLGHRRKAKIEKGYDPRGHRDAWQVLSNSLGASLLLLLDAYHRQWASSRSATHDVQSQANLNRNTVAVQLAVLAYYSACQGDTWSSEIGVLSKGEPRLWLGFGRRVPRGTNGGVSGLGIVASLLGGLFLGVMVALLMVTNVFFLVGFSLESENASLPNLATVLYHLAYQYNGASSLSLGLDEAAVLPHGADLFGCYALLVVVAVVAAVTGSVIDSVLGQFLQYSAFDTKAKFILNHPPPKKHKMEDVQHITGIDFLSNNAINGIAATMTALMTYFLFSV